MLSGFHMKTFIKILLIQLSLSIALCEELLTTGPKKPSKSSLIENCSSEILIKRLFSDSDKFIAIKFDSSDRAEFVKINLQKSFDCLIDFYVVNYQGWIPFLEKVLYRSLSIAKIEFPMTIFFKQGRVILPIFPGVSFDVSNEDTVQTYLTQMFSRLNFNSSQPWLVKSPEISPLLSINCSGRVL